MGLFIKRTITTNQPIQFGRPAQFTQPFQFGGAPFNRNHGSFFGGFRHEGHRFENEGHRFEHEGDRFRHDRFRHDHEDRRFGSVGNNYPRPREFGRFDDDRFNDERFDDEDSLTTGEKMSDFANGLEGTVSTFGNIVNMLRDLLGGHDKPEVKPEVKVEVKPEVKVEVKHKLKSSR